MTPIVPFPKTRYQGSKRKLLAKLAPLIAEFPIGTCLDAFGGTGAVSHLLRELGHQVTYNDILLANTTMARAVFATGGPRLARDEICVLTERRSQQDYKTIIQDHYQGVYFLNTENETIDTICTNIRLLSSAQARDEAYYLLFQALLSKRPYNLFHRANLTMRLREVPRTFGNKRTWERSIVDLMAQFWDELARYRQAARSAPVRITNRSAFEIEEPFDLVYIDTPYAKSRGDESNYFNFYHFLDALLRYDAIPDLIRTDFKHRPIYDPKRSWHPQPSIDQAFADLFRRFRDSVIVVSYRSDGYPQPADLQRLIGEQFQYTATIELGRYAYALASADRNSSELLFIGSNNHFGFSAGNAALGATN